MGVDAAEVMINMDSPPVSLIKMLVEKVDDWFKSARIISEHAVKMPKSISIVLPPY